MKIIHVTLMSGIIGRPYHERSVSIHESLIKGVHFIKPWLRNTKFDKEVIEHALKNCLKENLHFIFAAYTTEEDQSQIKKVFENAMAKNQITKASITFFEMIRAYCIPKEKYDKLLRQQEMAERSYIADEEVIESFGTDLEAFSNDNVPEKEQNVNTFYVTMLTPQEWKKLANGNIIYCRTFWKCRTMKMNPGKRYFKPLN